MNKFEYVVVAGARAKQLLRGCTPKVDVQHKAARTAMKEVTQRKIEKLEQAETATAE
ncbi:MAG TPA: DNA-directed RNA polymerase subunit omega [Vicinamibacterales bacterium]|jgi:DNA-directed RNA polymerase subunit K/omega